MSVCVTRDMGADDPREARARDIHRCRGFPPPRYHSNHNSLLLLLQADERKGKRVSIGARVGWCWVAPYRLYSVAQSAQVTTWYKHHQFLFSRTSEWMVVILDTMMVGYFI